MTDPGTADRTYIGPMTPELVEEILAKARFLVCITSEYQYVPPISIIRLCMPFPD